MATRKDFWRRTFNIRPGEGWLVKKLFLLQFFQGAGIAFFFTAAFALFLSGFQVTELPSVFIFSSLLLWITGFIYSRVEHKMPISKLAIWITVFMLISMLAFRMAYVYVKASWFIYVMLAWFNVLYLLNNLEFWGVASLIFDARQSKRLFGVISAGDIPAKFIGYTLALLTVSYIGTINLLWFGAACMLASLPFLISIRKSGILTEESNTPRHAPKHSVSDVSKIVKNFSGNVLIRRLSILSIIVSASFLINNFAFYAGVKEALHDDVSLAKFIAFFLAGVRIVALVVKVIFTSRLINKLGLIQSLLITPVILLVLTCIIVLTPNLPDHQKLIIYVFGATSIIADVLRSAISTPVFLTMMQPLPHHDRLRAHTIVKGIMDPFASLITGVVILLMIRYQQKVDLLALSYILLFICILWIVGIYRVNNQYLKTVISTISSRYFNGLDFSVTDNNTLDWLKEKLKTGSETEVINIITMLNKNGNAIKGEWPHALLEHPSETVKLTALKIIAGQETGSPDMLLQFLKETQNPLIIAETIKILCRHEVAQAIILPYIESAQPVVKEAALTGLLLCGTEQGKKDIQSILSNMAVSKSEADRLIVAEIFSNHPLKTSPEMILGLMNDESLLVRKAAFLAAGKSGASQLLKQLFGHINKDDVVIWDAVFEAGDAGLPYISKAVDSNNITPLQKEKLILVCGRIGSSEAKKLLLELLSKYPVHHVNTIKALYRGNYKNDSAIQPLLTETAKSLLARSAGLIYMQNRLSMQKANYHLLANSFHWELMNLRDSLLNLFAILYSRDNINKVRVAYATGKKSSIINAMEIIDLAVRKDIASHFNTIFEPGDIAERMHGLRKIYPAEFFENIEQVLVRILENDTVPYNNWTIACCLYTTKKQHHGIKESLIKKYTSADSVLLRETALYAL